MIRIHSNAGERIGEDDLNSLESGRERTRGDSNRSNAGERDRAGDLNSVTC